MRVAATVLIALCAGIPSARAADANNAYSIRGAGMITCETYAQAREKKDNLYFMVGGWLDGYVTGVNQFAPDTYDSLSFESTELVARLLDGHCKARPQDRIFAVTAAILRKFHGERLRERSDRVKVQAGEREFSIYAEVLSRAQRKLAELGYYQGDPEPQFGDKTREALTAFQEKSNIKATGVPDQVTLWRLFRQPDGSGQETVR